MSTYLDRVKKEAPDILKYFFDAKGAITHDKKTNSGQVEFEVKHDQLFHYETPVAQRNGTTFYVMVPPTTKAQVGGINPDGTATLIGMVKEQINATTEFTYRDVEFSYKYSGDLSALSPSTPAVPTPSNPTPTLASAAPATPTTATNTSDAKKTASDPAAPEEAAPPAEQSPSPSDNSPQFYRNTMISGTPGCGKSYFVDKYAIPAIVGTSHEDICRVRTTRVVFTEGYTYEDFFGCYKPQTVNGKDLKFAFIPGPFCRAVCKALQKKGENFVLVIEEMNRGNSYEIFGSLFQLLDRNEDPNEEGAVLGQSTYPIALSQDAAEWFKNQEHLENLDTDLFYLPQNLYIIATVNNADSRVQFMDTAMKRRFHGAYMDEEGVLYAAPGIPGIASNATGHQKITIKTTENTLDRSTYDTYRKHINNCLKEDKHLEDKLIAKYFAKMNEKDEINEVNFIINILGYLIQNVYRGRQLPTNLFIQEDARSLGQLLKTYFGKSEKLSAIIKPNPGSKVE